MGYSILGALLPVMLVVGAGWVVSRRGLVRQTAIKDVSNLVFLLLLPALLFRTMANVTVSDLDFYPVGIYFLSVTIVFAGTLAVYGFRTMSAAKGLAHVFSNIVMVGVPLVSLFYGEQALVPLFTLVTVHSLFVLGGATAVFEFASARERAHSDPDAPRSLLRTVGQVVKNSLLHPVPLPILSGILFAQTGWVLPDVIDKPLQMLATAMGPMALLLVGMTLGYARVGRMWRQGLSIALVKTLVHPFVFFICALVLGARGEAIVVLMMCAALPVGANVLLFTHRYGLPQDETVASMALSTLTTLVCIPIVVLVFSPFLS